MRGGKQRPVARTGSAVQGLEKQVENQAHSVSLTFND